MQGKISSPNFDFALALAGNNGRLREYKLVLPHDFRVKREHLVRYLRCVFDHIFMEPIGASAGVASGSGTAGNIKITLVLLDPHFRTLDRLVALRSRVLQEEYLLRRECVRIALLRGWEVVMANDVDPETGYFECGEEPPLYREEEFVSRVDYEAFRVPHGRWG